MTNNETYQGYSNRETWSAALWIANEMSSEKHWRTRTLELLNTASDDGQATLAQELKEEFERQSPQLPHGLFADLLTTAMCRINWDEIAQKLWEDYQTEVDESDYIHQYSRKEAIADGVLIDVTATAKEAGFKIPVAITHAAWFECIAVAPETKCQDEAGRLWDVLTVLFVSIKRTQKDRRSSILRFTVSVRTDEHTSRDIELKSICGPGDNAEPVLTILLPEED